MADMARKLHRPRTNKSGYYRLYSGMQKVLSYIIIHLRQNLGKEEFIVKNLKKILAVIVCVAMMIPTVAFAANTSPAKINVDTAAVSAGKLTYTGKTQSPKLTVTINGKTLVEGTDFVVTGKNKVTNAGTYEITISGKGNYTGEQTIKYTVAAKNVTAKAATANKYYTGSKVKTTPVVKADGKTLKAGVDYTVTGDVAIKPGLHKAVIKGKGNYSFTSSVYYRVKYSVPSYAKTTVAKTTYSGKAQAAKITVKNGSKTLKAGRDYVVSGTTKAKNAGKYTIKITGKGNYAGSKTITYTISKCNQKWIGIKTNNTSKKIAVSGVKGKAKVAYATNNSKVKVSGSKISIAKGVKSGTKVKITVKVGATKNFNAYKKTITYVVK